MKRKKKRPAVETSRSKDLLARAVADWCHTVTTILVFTGASVTVPGDKQLLLLKECGRILDIANDGAELRRERRKLRRLVGAFSVPSERQKKR